MSSSAVDFVPCIPDPSRVAEGLRDTGYEFETAVADIIDNSIAAGASIVDVHVAMTPRGSVLVSVVDNGYGMDRDGLINALRYGSNRRNDPSSLGKFGLGLKTASTAFCRRLSLISRPSAEEQPLKAVWDLDEVCTRGWSIAFSAPTSNELKLLDYTAQDSPGTLVVWDNVDRLLVEYKNMTGAPAKKALDRYISKLRQHVAMVYQRFLDYNDNRARNIIININKVRIDPWDPFAKSESGSPVVSRTVELVLPDGTHTSFFISAYILPRREEFSSSSAAKAALLGNDMQGIYVYRENRMIHGPDWLGMFRKEPHFTCCRVELSFGYQLDSAFQVDIKKSRILLDNDLYDWLRDKFLAAPRREAEQRYRKGQAAQADGVGTFLHTSSNNAIHAKANALRTADLEGYNAETGEGTLRNKSGRTTIKIKLLEPDQPGQVHVKAVPEITNGLLFEPAFIDGNQSVGINTSHPYYHKVYLPNRNSGVTIQGLDSLLWALCVAEQACINDETKRKFEEMRFEVSRILRQLVEDMPDAPEADA